MSNPKISKEQSQSIKALYREGFTARDIADDQNISIKTVYNHLKDISKKQKRKKGRAPLTVGEVENIYRLKKDGKSAADIAKKMGISRNTVYAQLRKKREFRSAVNRNVAIPRDKKKSKNETPAPTPVEPKIVSKTSQNDLAMEAFKIFKRILDKAGF